MKYYNQIPLHISLVEQYLTEDFIVSSYNQDVYKLLDPTSWGLMPYPSFVLIYGRHSSGKTHFCHIWQRVFNAKFIKGYEDIIHNIDLYHIVDDMQLMEPEEMFHIFNSIQEKQQICLLTTDVYPFKSGLRDLDSRINSVRVVQLNMPDDEMVRVFLMRQFKIRSMQVSSEVIDYISARVPYDLEQILKIMQHIDNEALINKSKITTAFMRKLFNH